MVAHPNPCRLFSLMPVVVRKIPEPGNGGLKHRDVDELAAAGFFSLIEGQKDSDRGIHRGSQIDDRQAHFCRLIGISCGRNDSGFALDQQVIGFHVAIRAVLPVPGQGTINQPGIAGARSAAPSPMRPGDAWREVFQNNVDSFRQREGLPPGRLSSSRLWQSFACCR